MLERLLSTPASRVLLIALLLLACAGPLRAADLPLAAGSPLVGFSFDDRPLMLPVQQNFQMALLTASGELGRSCGKMEAYGWRMRQNEQQRVNQIFNNTVDRLRGLGYVVESQAPSSLSRDVTLFTVDRPEHHFIFMWSAGEIGLVMVLCESTPPLINKNATEAYASPMPDVRNYPATGAVVSSELKKVSHDDGRFTPIGHWAGSYTCAQGYTGGTLDVTSLKGEKFEGTFSFYPTRRNPYITSGSYRVYGQYDKASHRILINPGKWIRRPKGYFNTIMVGIFDPAQRSFSGTFQGITGCTSLEARLAGPVKKEKAAKAKKTRKKRVAKKAAASTNTAPLSDVPAPTISAPAAAELPASTAPIPSSAPSPGITLSAPASQVSPLAPASAGGH